MDFWGRSGISTGEKVTRGDATRRSGRSVRRGRRRWMSRRRFGEVDEMVRRFGMGEGAKARSPVVGTAAAGGERRARR